MLSALSIRDIVLIESLDLEFRSGLTALTGETGAGKSILLDALTLALGGRGDAGLVRQGCAQGQVTAVFDVGRGHPVWGVMEESGIDANGDIVLRRVQNADGRSRAFVNDRPTSVQLLRDVGAQLVEIHGQHDDRALVDTAFHLALLDAFAENGEPLEETARLYTSWRGAEKAVADAVKTLEEARQEEDFLRHAVAELERLNPHAGEEEALAVRRQTMMAAEKLASDLNEVASAVSGEDAPDARLAAILRKLERRREEAPELLGGLLDAMSAALDALDGVRLSAEEALREAAFDPSELEATEERLFSLRAASRKYGVQTDGLSALADKMRGELDLIDAGEGSLEKAKAEAEAARAAYGEAAAGLSAARAAAAATLDQAVNSELPSLRLDAARFFTDFRELGFEAASATGWDGVEFHVQTNPGSRPGPLLKVASGGELSRFLLALKVSLADKGSAPTLVFDEIDTAVGGAVSDAIGQRLARLANGVQVLTVTHAPQVAARADHHCLISKNPVEDGARVSTEVNELQSEARREEIARMLAGATVTDEARAAADRLMAVAG